MAINTGENGFSMYNNYYIHCALDDEDIQKYFNAIIKANLIICDSEILRRSKYENIKKYKIINVFCLCINDINISIENFRFCLFEIVKYINFHRPHVSRELKNIQYFALCINKLLYYSKKKIKYKKCANKILEKYASQIFMEYLDLYYYEYLKKIFAPGGKGYIKTKNHFESTVKKIKK